MNLLSPPPRFEQLVRTEPHVVQVRSLGSERSDEMAPWSLTLISWSTSRLRKGQSIENNAIWNENWNFTERHSYCLVLCITQDWPVHSDLSNPWKYGTQTPIYSVHNSSKREERAKRRSNSNLPTVDKALSVNPQILTILREDTYLHNIIPFIRTKSKKFR